jgi:hypothetical protein
MNLVDEIVLVLKNHSNPLKLNSIYDELRKKGINNHYLDELSFEGSVRATLQAHCKDFKRFSGNHLFKWLNRGLWQLNLVIKENIIHTTIISQEEKLELSNNTIYFTTKVNGYYEVLFGEVESISFEIGSSQMMIHFDDQNGLRWSVLSHFDLEFIRTLAKLNNDFNLVT